MQSLLQYRRIQADVSRKSRAGQASIISTASAAASTRSDADDKKEEDDNPSTPGPAVATKSSGRNGSTVLVTWEGPNDPANPRNWSLSRRIWITAIVWINVFALDWASSSNSQAKSLIADDFGVSEEVESLSAALYVYGIAAGALFAGPIAETVGRNPIYVGSRILHFFFVMGSGLAQNIQQQLVCRFFAGLGASIILAIHGASIADIFTPYGRSLAWPFVASGSFFGTVLAPVAGGWITQSAEYGGLSWRWTEWVALIITGVTFLITFIWLPETFAPILLKWKAAALRRETGDSRYLCKLELQDTFGKRLIASLHRAWVMTIREPIVTLLGLWLVIVYAVLFGFLQGFKYLFEITYKLDYGLRGTCFAAIALGITLYVIILSPIWQYIHKKQSDAWAADSSKSGTLPPEYRLPQAFPIAFTLPISLFWLGWTNYPQVSIWSDLGAVTLFGFSWAGVYIAVYLYILDVYGIYAGSALASITFYRYAVAASMTVASEPMYEAMGTHWVGTFLGLLAVCLGPAPFVFYKYGPWVRSKSRFAGHHVSDLAEEEVEDDSQLDKQEQKAEGEQRA